ncbi:UPF0057-domain-containing protein [Dissoconium aciculare CBS 342.82]|jgi:uncharacterized membrane protein YqaE (UPF0057 family)|uniref:UPF0057-domain-containing protein n=1 Tax=Dissoconium aciculare CBS 342.82 TaxID=1314786 RepID=A0A6J3LZQ0_9PEZI|nr:UPF0057-domain-containing protein [Dissoconium aciculare CBS 342.82]KAF1821133.1 UPF0057-domain-containing protein [Dissoconium aciculare CBS 342.82]
MRDPSLGGERRVAVEKLRVAREATRHVSSPIKLGSAPAQPNTFLTESSSDIIKIILAILLPPLGVFLERGCGADLLINIILTCLGYIPGIIHALYVSHL